MGTVPTRLRADIARLGERDLDLRGFMLAAARALRREVAFEGICLLTFDPATALPTRDVVENALPPAALPRLLEIEMREPDINKFVDLAHAGIPAAALSEATGGELNRSRRHRELRGPHGFGDELRGLFTTDAGAWGAITLSREAGRPDFTAADTRLVASLSRAFAEGVQGIIIRPVRDDETRPPGAPPGVIVLAGDNSIEMANRGAEEWLAELGEGEVPGARLPPVIHAVAARARATPGDPDGTASARIRIGPGRWALARATSLGDGPGGHVAVTLEAARSPELAPLVADAYSLTNRERLVTQLVAQGHRTAAIAQRLHLSAYTVQDHLKSVFEKVGVASRGELVARLFFEHHAPRLL
ncbi:MAG: helix-turn-helix transcriptional regulator [Thermoleophilia bacterium]|nr:helix-turn-helix transcriptional regulator [Thermoleophilia bacterium]